MKEEYMMVIMCPACAEAELAGKAKSPYGIDYDEYYCSGGLEFFGCSHLSVVEKEPTESAAN